MTLKSMWDTCQRYKVFSTGWPKELETVEIGRTDVLAVAERMASSARMAPGCVGTAVRDTWAGSIEEANDLGERDAQRRQFLARQRADAEALAYLAAMECPLDLQEWGERHNIPTFAQLTWQAGFIQGWRMANGLGSGLLPPSALRDVMEKAAAQAGEKSGANEG